MAEALERTLRPLSLALAGFYALLVGYWVVALRPNYSGLGMVWAFNAAAFSALALSLSGGTHRRLGFSSLVVATLTTVSGGLLLRETGNPALAIALCVTILGLSLVVIARWVLVVAAVGALSFVAWASRDWPTVGWSAALFAVVAACIVAFLAQFMRIRAYDRLEEAHRRERASDARMHEEKQARQEAEAMIRFLRLAAHQLGNPLTSVTIQARRMTQAPFPDPAWQRSAQILDRNVQRLGRVVGDILLVSQHQGGILVLQLEHVDLVQIIQHAIAKVARLHPNVAIAPRLPACVWMKADAGKLEIAIGKLLENAIQHGAGKPVEIDLAVQSGEVIVSVIDHGEGVPLDRRAGLFELPELDVMLPGGGGLGLPVCKAIVEAHKGTLQYRDLPDGSLFSIHLPEPKERAALGARSRAIPFNAAGEI